MRSHLRSTVVALGLGALLVSCSPGPDTSPTSISSESPVANPSPTAFVPSQTPNPEQSLSLPGSFGDDLTFGYSEFAGAPVGSTNDEFTSATGLVGTRCSQGMWNFFPPETNAEDWDWLLWAPSLLNESNPEYFEDGTPAGWTIDFFSLQPNWGVDASEPFGPTGPGGIRLGSTDGAVLAAFPDVQIVERPVVDLRVSDEVVTFWDYIYAAPDGTSIVFVVRDGLVISIYWGSADLADGPLYAGCD